MTRFKQEITGLLDAQVAARTGEENKHYWENRAKKEVIEKVAYADEHAVVDCNGAISWKSNGSYLMDDFCEMLEYAGYNFSREATRKARDFQNEQFFEELRKHPHIPTEEEKAEMRAEFGVGAVVVDLTTGKKYTIR